MKTDPRTAIWQAPELRELDLLTNNALGFSEPDPPSQSGASGNQNEEQAVEDANREMFDWL